MRARFVPEIEELEQSLADLGVEDRANHSDLEVDGAARFQTPPNHAHETEEDDEDGDEEDDEDGDQADNEESSDNEERILIICELASNDHSHTPRGMNYRFFCKKCQKDFSTNSSNVKAHRSAKNCSFEKDVVKQRFKFL